MAASLADKSVGKSVEYVAAGMAARLDDKMVGKSAGKMVDDMVEQTVDNCENLYRFNCEILFFNLTKKTMAKDPGKPAMVDANHYQSRPASLLASSWDFSAVSSRNATGSLPSEILSMSTEKCKTE